LALGFVVVDFVVEFLGLADDLAIGPADLDVEAVDLAGGSVDLAGGSVDLALAAVGFEVVAVDLVVEDFLGAIDVVLPEVDFSADFL